MQKIRKKFLMIQVSNQYNVLTQMLDVFQKYLETNTDMDVRRAGTMEQVYQEIENKPEFVFSLQAACFDWKMPDGNYLMQTLANTTSCKILGWIVDSPYYHTSKICGVNDKMKLAVVDYFSGEYIKKYFDIPCDIFHHFGIEAEQRIPICERDIEVFVPVSWSSTKEFERNKLKDLEENEIYIVKHTLDLLLRDKDILVNEALEQTFLTIGMNVPRDEFGDLVEWFEILIDEYYRVKQREQCILALLKMGVSLTVCGKGWENYEGEYRSNGLLKILGDDLSFEEVANVMKRARIVLNIVPTYHEGIHERLATAMLHGAVCLTDPSQYLEKHFTDGKDILFYEWDNLEGSLAKVKNYLNDNGKLQEMADKAYTFAKKHMTVANFAHEVLDAMTENG